mgnify:CR=1 FL=1
MKAADFIARVAPVAVRLRLEGSPIFPSLRIAQAAHETGWTLHEWNNLVGLKAGSGKPTPYWDGTVKVTRTWEVIGGQRVETATSWRAYKSIEDCFRDQDLLFAGSRYARVRAARTPEEQADMLQACGYATDPRYAEKLKAVMAAYNLVQYDREALRMQEVIKSMEERLKRLEEKAGELEKRLNPVPAPAWFVAEFGSADLGGLIREPALIPEAWRALAVALRAQRKA